jgi:hypothetical protein
MWYTRDEAIPAGLMNSESTEFANALSAPLVAAIRGVSISP